MMKNDDVLKSCRQALSTLREQTITNDELYTKSLSLLLKIITNLNRFSDVKYRQIKQSKLKLSSIKSFLQVVGFKTSDDNDTMVLHDENTETIVAVLRLLTTYNDTNNHERELNKAAVNLKDDMFSFVSDNTKTASSQQQTNTSTEVKSMFDKNTIDDDDDDDDGKPIEPTYNLSELTKALNRDEYDGATQAEYIAALKILLKIANNLKNQPKKASFRVLNPSNKTFHHKMGRWNGGLNALRFIGFELDKTAERLRMRDDLQDETRRIERTVQVVTRVLNDAMNEKEFHDSIIIPDRNITVVDVSIKNDSNNNNNNDDDDSKTAITTTTTTAVVNDVNDEDDDDDDKGLLLKAWSSSQKHLQQSQRFVDRRKLEEERLKQLPTYNTVLIRVHFKDHNVHVCCYFHPNEKISELFNIIDSMLLPNVSNDYYFRAPPTTRIKREQDKTFKELRLIPSATVYFCTNDGKTAGDFLQDTWLSVKTTATKLQTPKSIRVNDKKDEEESKKQSSKKQRKPNFNEDDLDAEVEAMLAGKRPFKRSKKKKSSSSRNK